MSLILLFFVIVITILYFSAHLHRLIGERKLRQFCRKEGILCLSYDDGPGAELTPELLSLLDQYQAKATFFTLGHRAKKHPELLSAIVKQGHELGSHTQNHINAWKASPWKVIHDINMGYKQSEPLLQPQSIFRPPYGKLTLASLISLKIRGAKIGWWTTVSGDTFPHLPSIPELLTTIKNNHGGVILMHDFDRQGADSDDRKRFVLEATEALLSLAQAQNWTVYPLGKLLNKIHDKSAS